MHLPGELKVFFIYLVGVDCQLGIDLIFSLGSYKEVWLLAELQRTKESDLEG